MASNLTDRAERRAAGVRAAIRDLLAAGNPHAAFNAAVSAIQGEAARVRRRRPADAMLADAELAASIAGLAARLYAHQPRKPAGCPKVPGPEHLLAVFDAIYGGDQQ